MEYCKLQIGCLIIALYIGMIYMRERRIYNIKKRDKLFDLLIIAGIFEIIVDGSTAYTVNHIDKIPGEVNLILHMFFLTGLDLLVYLMFIYMWKLTNSLPVRGKRAVRFWTAATLPLVINVIIVVLFIDKLYYVEGKITNYSMGIPVYTCYIMAAIYTLLSVAVFIHKWRGIESHKRISISTYLVASVLVTAYQMLNPEALITCLVPTMVVLSAYLNQENPILTRLRGYNKEMVMSFSTLVESRDDNTGGHIQRSTAYVEILANELKDRGLFTEELTKDYIKDLVMAAPMHDIGKISIPDSILKKPGKLDDEEFAIMKTHAAKGGEIIEKTFGHIGEDSYEKMAYKVARYHHEKWNGKGYPEGKAGEDIPLCARIMSVADVFDAVSAKRCYRDAMPLSKCYEIIEDGRGRDFDPRIVDTFLDIKGRIEEVYREKYDEEMHTN